MLFCVGVKFHHVQGRTQAEVILERALHWIYGLERQEVAGDWRKLYIEEFHDLHSLQNIFLVFKCHPIFRQIEAS